tara:strand:- start:1746 stop:2087 length:342 start_codon:yes stop_codon:yes gene_type:complete
MSRQASLKNQVVRFKDIDITFEFNRMPSYDREYLKTMVIETINNRSVKHSGRSFESYYRNASNFALFNNYDTMEDWMDDFSGDFSYAASHLLHGKKYYLAWTHSWDWPNKKRN